MRYKIKPYIEIENECYGALIDDIVYNLDMNTFDLNIEKIESVLHGIMDIEKIYGNICYHIIIEKIESKIFCYNEFLGKEPTIDIFNMLKDYRNALFEYKKMNNF